MKDVPSDKGAATITKAIIALARSLDLSVVAEGVENETQAAFLRAHNCDELQGHLFSEPLVAHAMTRLLRPSSANVSH